MNRTLLLFFSLSLSAVLWSQEVSYKFKNLSTANGLSQSTVIAIHQDVLGQMWLGTRDGLNKYDGHNFILFKNDPLDSLSISNNDILSIEESKDGNIWVGTYNGLNLYNPQKNTFKRFFHQNNKSSLSNNTIWCIKEIKNEIWLGTSNGLTIYNKDTNNFKVIYHSSQEATSLVNNYVLSILETKNGDIFIGTAKGLSKLVSRKNDAFKFKNYSVFNKKTNLFIQDIKEDEHGQLWIGTKNYGLVKFDVNSSNSISLLNEAKYKDIGKDVRALDFDHKGALWVGTYDGVVVIQTGEKIVRPRDISNLDKVKSVYTDKNGSVWIGTYYKGVNIWDISNSNFTNLNQNSIETALSFNAIGSMASDANKNIYFGTEGGGITVFNSLTRQTRFINKKNSVELNSDNIKSLYLAEDGLLWIGTFTDGMSCYNTKTQKFVINSINQ